MNILITGANRGLGLCLTEAALAAGHRVVAAVRNRASGLAALAALSESYPGAVFVVELDVASEDDARSAAETVKREVGAIDAIVNNAAILVGRSERIDTLDLEDVRKTFEINLFGAMRVVKHFLPLLREGTGRRSIVNVSSEAGSFSNAYGKDYPYALSKSALNYFSQQLAKDLASEDIAVLAVHPGWMRTDMGGERAPLDPRDSARSILELVDRRKEAGKGAYAFVDFTGKDMPI